jgi:hypothetical protein
VFEGVQDVDLIPVENLQGAPGDEKIREEANMCAVSAQRRDYDDRRRRPFPTSRKSTPWAGLTINRYDARNVLMKT